MAVDLRKRQKKLEHMRRKQKAERRELARRQPQGMGDRLLAAASAPILHCCASETLWYEGLGHVLISREAEQRERRLRRFPGRYVLSGSEGCRYERCSSASLPAELVR